METFTAIVLIVSLAYAWLAKREVRIAKANEQSWYQRWEATDNKLHQAYIDRNEADSKYHQLSKRLQQIDEIINPESEATN